MILILNKDIDRQELSTYIIGSAGDRIAKVKLNGGFESS